MMDWYLFARQTYFIARRRAITPAFIWQMAKRILVSKVLKDLDEALSGPDFFRVHGSYLVNLNHIKRFVRGEGGYLVMDNDVAISVSRSRRQEFIELFSRF